MKTIKIGDFRIDLKSETYVIAEAGVNHNGEISKALKLVQEAVKIGANCIKFQTFKANKVVTKNSPKADYQLEVTNRNESQFDMLKKLELNLDDYKKILEKCNSCNIQFLSTPYNEDDAEFLSNLGVDAFKIASGQLVEIPFLEHVAMYGKPMIISTGMATLSEIYDAVQAIRGKGNDQIVVLQCTTNYPSKIEDSNIMCMNSFGNALDVIVGYSDHVPNNYACYAAVALGAKVIEKHFTLDKKLEGPDHSSSLDVREFEELIEGIRNIEMSLGSSVKQPSESEKKNIFGMRRSIVSSKNLTKGHIISREDVEFKRPADGLAPNKLYEILGKRLSKDVAEDESLKYSTIEW